MCWSRRIGCSKICRLGSVKSRRRRQWLRSWKLRRSSNSRDCIRSWKCRSREHRRRMNDASMRRSSSWFWRKKRRRISSYRKRSRRVEERHRKIWICISGRRIKKQRSIMRSSGKSRSCMIINWEWLRRRVIGNCRKFRTRLWWLRRRTSFLWRSWKRSINDSCSRRNSLCCHETWMRSYCSWERLKRRSRSTQDTISMSSLWWTWDQRSLCRTQLASSQRYFTARKIDFIIKDDHCFSTPHSPFIRSVVKTQLQQNRRNEP